MTGDNAGNSKDALEDAFGNAGATNIYGSEDCQIVVSPKSVPSLYKGRQNLFHLSQGCGHRKK